MLTKTMVTQRIINASEEAYNLYMFGPSDTTQTGQAIYSLLEIVQMLAQKVDELEQRLEEERK
jgi:hypothetical protein